MKKLMTAILCLVLVGMGFMPHYAASEGEPRFTASVVPEMELLAGVLTQTTWMKQRGPAGEGNEYFRALKEYFAPYKDHEAVKVAQELTDLGFTYDAPPGFICHLGSLPELKLEHEYSDYLVGRAKGRERLERFRIALRDLAEEMEFETFFQQWQPQFDKWVSASHFDGSRVVAWLEEFFGKKASEFHLVLAPAMFPGGGYGPSIRLANGELISYQVVRENGRSTTAPEFPAGRSLEFLSLHEWGHSFVNPSIERFPAEVQKLNHLFKPVRTAMNNQAYSSVGIYINEQVLRAVTALAEKDLYGVEAYQRAIENENVRSFFWTDNIAAMLEEYRDNRAEYPTFDDYVPTLLRQMQELRTKRDNVILYVGALGAVCLISTFIRKRALQKS